MACRVSYATTCKRYKRTSRDLRDSERRNSARCLDDRARVKALEARLLGPGWVTTRLALSLGSQGGRDRDSWTTSYA
jgi:hypothetical protein